MGGLTAGAFVARYAFALLVAGAPYNPRRYSYYAWAKGTGWQWQPLLVFVGVVLPTAWPRSRGSRWRSWPASSP
jgi:Family of unknown function (DUF6524)